MDKPKIALIDGDILRYQIGAVTSKDGTITLQGVQVDVPQSNELVERQVKEHISATLKATGCSEARIYLSESRNFRFKRATIQPYKGNRVGFVKPYHWKTVGNILRENYGCIICEEFEADDHLAKDQDIDGGTTVICSRDKDLRIRAGWHYSWSAGTRCPEKPLYWINEIEGIKWFYTQMLTGDSTDNILGCGIKKPTSSGKLRRNGVGPKEAEKTLHPFETEEDLFFATARQYQKVFGTEWEEPMRENGTLLWMSHELIPWEELDKVNELFEKFKKQ